MSDKSICRIGVFYDGSYFAYPQRYFYHKRKLGWLSFKPFHKLIETYLATKEQGFTNYRIVYASWVQGLFTSTKTDERQLRNERNLHHDLMHAGIEVKYHPMSQSQGEKGADVALAIDALQIGLEDKIDIAVFVSGDGDLVPLVRALNRVLGVFSTFLSRPARAVLPRPLSALAAHRHGRRGRPPPRASRICCSQPGRGR